MGLGFGVEDNESLALSRWRRSGTPRKGNGNEHLVGNYMGVSQN